MRIGIIGAIGVDDIGDVVMLEVTLKQLKEISNSKAIDIEFTIFALNKEKAESQINEMGIRADVIQCLAVQDLSISTKNLPFSQLLEANLKNVINNDLYYYKFKQCDALFFIGGGYFNEYWGDRLLSTFILPIALAYQLSKPIFISGVNLGPFQDKQLTNYVGLFKRVNTIILRDRTPSIETLKKLGGTSGTLILGADDILPKWYNKELIHEDLFESNHKYAVIQLHHWVEKYCKNYIKLYQTLSDFINGLFNNGSIEKIYFMPFTYFKGADYECGRRLKTFLDEREEYVVLKPTNDHIFMRKLISSSEFLIASRYHPIVYGLGEQISTLGIYVNDLYKQKISGAYDVVEANKDDNMVDINDIKTERLVNWYKSIEKNPGDKCTDQNRLRIIDGYANTREKCIEEFITSITSERVITKY